MTTIRRSTVLDADAARVWTEVNKPRLLFEVAWPLVRFVLMDPVPIGAPWKPAKHRVRMLLFGFVPIGEQVIGIERPPAVDGIRSLRDNGSSRLMRRWDHLISVHELADGKTRYTDCVEIDAGRLTFFVSCFAQLFYWHRQRRLRRLAKRGFVYPAG